MKFSFFKQEGMAYEETNDRVYGMSFPERGNDYGHKCKCNG